MVHFISTEKKQKSGKTGGASLQPTELHWNCIINTKKKTANAEAIHWILFCNKYLFRNIFSSVWFCFCEMYFDKRMIESS